MSATVINSEYKRSYSILTHSHKPPSELNPVLTSALRSLYFCEFSFLSQITEEVAELNYKPGCLALGPVTLATSLSRLCIFTPASVTVWGRMSIYVCGWLLSVSLTVRSRNLVCLSSHHILSF